MKVIAADLDRTLIPNGNHSLNKGAMGLFKKKLKKNKIKLIYVTGRYKRLILDGIKRYNLPKPNYCSAYLGTVIYKYQNGKLIDINEWQKVLAKDWKNYRQKDIAELLKNIKGLKQQEKIKLDEFKQSYYISPKANKEKIVRKIRNRLKRKNIQASIIYSVDVNRKIGLLDITPKHGIKGAALNFLLKRLKVSKNDVLYAGDSGNDIDPIVCGFNSVLVKNAAPQIKKNLQDIVKRKHLGKKVYFAKGNFQGLNGNYVSGIIEGAYHFGFFR